MAYQSGLALSPDGAYVTAYLEGLHVWEVAGRRAVGCVPVVFHGGGLPERSRLAGRRSTGTSPSGTPSSGRTRGGPGGLSGARSTPRADSRLPTIARARDTAEVATAHDTPLRSATGDQFSNVLTFRRRRFGFVQHAVPHSSQRRLFGVLTRPERFRRNKISSAKKAGSSTRQRVSARVCVAQEFLSH